MSSPSGRVSLDAWSVGDEPCVFVEFSRGNDLWELA
jgi:hypothetical protein